MKKIRLHILLLIVLSLFLVSCKKQESKVTLTFADTEITDPTVNQQLSSNAVALNATFEANIGEVEAKTKNVAEYPLVKKILEEFKGAKIETIIRKNLSILSEKEPDLSGEIVNTYYDEEE